MSFLVSRKTPIQIVSQPLQGPHLLGGIVFAGYLQPPPLLPTSPRSPTPFSVVFHLHGIFMFIHTSRPFSFYMVFIGLHFETI